MWQPITRQYVTNSVSIYNIGDGYAVIVEDMSEGILDLV